MIKNHEGLKGKYSVWVLQKRYCTIILEVLTLTCFIRQTKLLWYMYLLYLELLIIIIIIMVIPNILRLDDLFVRVLGQYNFKEVKKNVPQIFDVSQVKLSD